MRRNIKVLGALALVSGLIAAGGCTLGGGASSDKFYTVTFVQDGYEAVTRTVKEGTALVDVPTPQPVEGYTVVWENVDVSNVTTDLTIEAVATANDYLITYQVSEADGETLDGELTQTVTYDAAYELATPTKENYDFLAWKANDQILSQTGTWNIASDVTLVPTWKVSSYTIVFSQTDGTEVVRLVDFGSTLPAEEIPTPIPVDGYDVAWSITDFSTVTGNTNVTVVKTPKQYTVSYQLENGETLDSDTFEYNSTYELKLPTKDGYTFRYWKDAKGTPIPPTGTWNYLNNLELTAEWTANDNLITFLYKDGTTVERTLQTGATLTDIPTLNPVEGYDVAWSITDFTTVTGTTTVTEVRTPKTYVVTFIVPEDAGMNGKTQEIVYASDYTLPTPEWDGYTFASWEYNGASIGANGNWSIANNVELKATWLCTVTFVYQDETTVVRTVKKGEALTDIPACNDKKGYILAWDVTDFSKIESNMTVVEEVKAKKYTVTFNPNNGSVSSTTMSVTYDKEYTLLTPTRNGYKFEGWYDQEGKKVELTGVWTTDSNVTLTASWTEIKNNDGWTNNY